MAQKLHQILFFQCFQYKYAAAGEQSGIDFKGWIFCCGANEYDAALLNKRQKCILLGFVKAVDLVYEQNGAYPHATALLGLVHDFFDFFNSAGNGAEINKISFGLSGDNAGKSGLANTGRAPEYHRRDLIPFDQLPEDLTLSEQMLLPHKIFECVRTKAAGKRGRLPAVIK